MADNVQDATFEILTGIQASIADVRGTIDELRVEMVNRFEKVEDGLRKERRNNAGTLVMMRATAGFFEERMKRLEERVEGLEERRA